MTDARPSNDKSSSEQVEWDRKSSRISIAARTVKALLLVGILSSLTWAAFTYAAPALAIIGDSAPHSLNEIEKAEEDLKKTQNIIFATIGSFFFLYLPLMLAMNYMQFKIGRRPPKGGWIDRPAQPISVSIEKLNDTLRLFRVTSLRSPSDEYLFEVQRIVHERKSRKSDYSFFIAESNDKIWVRSTIESGTLLGLTEDETTKYIINQISYILEEKTDFFKSTKSVI